VRQQRDIEFCSSARFDDKPVWCPLAEYQPSYLQTLGRFTCGDPSGSCLHPLRPGVVCNTKSRYMYEGLSDGEGLMASGDFSLRLCLTISPVALPFRLCSVGVNGLLSNSCSLLVMSTANDVVVILTELPSSYRTVSTSCPHVILSLIDHCRPSVCIRHFSARH